MTRVRRCSIGILTAFLCSCATPDPAVPSASAEVYPNVRILPEACAESAVLVDDTLYIPTSCADSELDLKEGDVVVSGGATGFMRRLLTAPTLSPSGPPASPPVTTTMKPRGLDELWLEVKTAVADLLDVISDVDADLSFPLDPIEVGVDDYPLVGDASGGVRASTASLHITPQAHLQLRVVHGRIQKAALGIQASTTGDLNIEVFSQVDAHWSASTEIWKSPALPLRFNLGPVPIVSSVSLSLVLGAEASVSAVASVGVGVQCRSQVDALVSWDPASSWTASAEHDDSCKTLGPSVTLEGTASALARLSVAADWDVVLIGGLRLALLGHAKLNASVCPEPGRWVLSSGIAAEVSGQLSPLSIDIGSFGSTLYAADYPLATGSLGSQVPCPWDHSPCLSDEECAPGYFCLLLYPYNQCTRPCSGAEPCPTNMACAVAFGPGCPSSLDAKQFCLPAQGWACWMGESNYFIVSACESLPEVNVSACLDNYQESLPVCY